MDIDYALLADYAEIVNSKLYVMGGGWDVNTVASLPANLRFSVALGVRVDWEETGQPIPVTVVVEDDDGAEYVRVQGQMQVSRGKVQLEGSTQLSQLAATLGVTFANAGGYRVRAVAGEGEGAVEQRLPFRVILSQGTATGS